MCSFRDFSTAYSNNTIKIFCAGWKSFDIRATGTTGAGPGGPDQGGDVQQYE